MREACCIIRRALLRWQRVCWRRAAYWQATSPPPWFAWLDEMLNPKQPAPIERRDDGVRAGGKFVEEGGDVPAEVFLRNR